MIKILILFFICIPTFAASFNDLSKISQEFLEKKSKKEEDAKWFKKYQDSYEQAMTDSQVMNEQIFFDDRIICWALEKKKKILELESIDNETIIECCRYFTLMFSKNLNFPSKIQKELKDEHLDVFIEFIRKRKDE